jgi:4-hydroxythreonine-4-phosphate dehydrogenase
MSLQPVGITMGDASGVGPEIALAAFERGELNARFVLFGDLAALQFYARRLNRQVPFRSAAVPADLAPGVLNVVDSGALSEADITPGQLSKAAGSAAHNYVVTATRAALAGEISAIVTLPMNKEATQLSDPHFTGHTELIGDVCGVRDVTIMLVSDQLIVTHVSTHVSLRQAIELAKKDRICTIIRLTVEAVKRLRKNPKIAVAGLNPHAGENGLFGDEEREEIRPAVEWAKAQGLPVDGPFPPDTLFHMAVHRKAYDAVVCMYHDQGHVPLKLLDFEHGVNVTLGLPIIRTSVDHGTAFDIAGKGIASTSSLVRAFDLGVMLARGGPLT